MSSVNRRRSPQRRYWKAKLEPLGRPAFWASATILILLLLFAWKYYSDPDWKNKLFNRADISDNQNQGNRNAQPEVAELEPDSLSESTEVLLLRELDRQTNFLPKDIQRQQVEVPKTDDVLSQYLPSSPAAQGKQPEQDKSDKSNPLSILGGSVADYFGNSANQNSDGGNQNSASRSSRYYEVNSPEIEQQAITSNPLKDALEQLKSADTEPEKPPETENSESQANSYLTQGEVTVPQQLGSSNNLAPQNSQPPLNSFTYLTQPGSGNSSSFSAPVQPFQPGGLVPNPEPVSPQLSNTFTTPQQDGTDGTADVPRLITNPGFRRNFRSPALQPIQPNQQTRERIPGRYLGGGEINTFSNP